MKNKIYIIGIGGIGVSAIARYYLQQGWDVFGSDSTNSELIEKLQSEGCDIIIGKDEKRLDDSFDLIVYTEAIPNTQEELTKSKELGIKLLTYPKALAEIANQKKLITIAGTHGKSTTTSLTSIILKNSNIGINAVIGTILKEFDGKNTYFSNSEYFTLEACEYKRSFLAYKPTIAVIINIEIDHLDYYKDLNDYISAYKEYLDNVVSGGYAILNGEDENCKQLLGVRKDIGYIEVYNDYFTFDNNVFYYPKINMQIPGNHILFDAKIAYVISHILGLNDKEIVSSLEGYNGVWRRMESIGKTSCDNLLISDYGHHPTEIKLTLGAIKEKYSDKKIVTIFQPHQYNRTLELLEDFKTCFTDTDILIVPNIYESRDSEEDKQKINSEKLVKEINHKEKYDGKGFKNTYKMIQELEKNNIMGSLVIILLGAGDVDDLRFDFNIES